MDWITVKEYEDITYKNAMGSLEAFNRPDVRNAFRPKRHQNYTVHFMMRKKILLLGLFLLLKVLHQRWSLFL
jgi:naphthoate synthase